MWTQKLRKDTSSSGTRRHKPGKLSLAASFLLCIVFITLPFFPLFLPLIVSLFHTSILPRIYNHSLPKKAPVFCSAHAINHTGMRSMPFCLSLRPWETFFFLFMDLSLTDGTRTYPLTNQNVRFLFSTFFCLITWTCFRDVPLWKRHHEF